MSVPLVSQNCSRLIITNALPSWRTKTGLLESGAELVDIHGLYDDGCIHQFQVQSCSSCLQCISAAYRAEA